MPTLAQVRATVDNWVDTRWPTVVARQETFFANRGRYWQGLITHSTIPTHTTTVDGSSLADRLNSGPTDQNSTWANVFPEWLTDLFPAAVWVDSYKGPLGYGWTLNVLARYNGNLWRRIVNVGPETWRSMPWEQVTLT